jgi:hypothetical protein
MSIPSSEKVRCCWICGKPCGLETCKIDEHGMPVHEGCYVARIALKKASTSEIVVYRARA